MNKDTVEQRIDKFLADFEALTNAISWGIDKRIRFNIAAQYMTKEKEFHAKQFLEVSDYIKKQLTWFSSIPQEIRYAIATLLINKFSNPIQAFDDLKDCYVELTESGFKKGPNTYIAAFILLSNQQEDTNKTDRIQKAMEIYKAMRKQHFFLTSNDDYPLAMLLSQTDCKIEEQMEDIDFYYQYLGNLFYKRGNDLQYLSHILTYGQKDNREALAVDCVSLFDEFRKQSIKIKGMHYPALGVLTLLKNKETAISDILMIYSQLKERKQLHRYKDICFLIAIQMFVQDHISQNDIFSIGMAANIQTILQAQEAASIAAITAVSAAAASSSSSN
ncbi:MAG: DUF4003 family protein [Heyndrickxia sp.]